MTDKQMIIDVCPYQGECSVSGCKRNDEGCFIKQLFEERYRAENQIINLNKMVKVKEQTLKEVQQIVLNIRNDEDFVGEGKLWQMVFDIEKIISEVKGVNI